METYRIDMCFNCDSLNHHDLKLVTMRDGRQMLKGTCAQCGTSRALGQDKPAEDFVMPYGKHKGLALKDIPRDYLLWVKNNSEGSVNRKVSQFLAET